MPIAGSLIPICSSWPARNASGTVTRDISVKQGTALFFPLVNIEWDNECGRPSLGGNCNPRAKKYPNNLGVPKLQAFAAGYDG